MAFLKLFDVVTYLDGGVDSGFNHVKPQDFKPRLMRFSGKKYDVRISECPLESKSLNKGDVFLLDLGTQLIRWDGPLSSHQERGKAQAIINNIKSDRMGRASAIIIDGDEDHDVFWTKLGGKAEIQGPVPIPERKNTPKVLFRISDASGRMQVDPVETTRSSLDTDDVFGLDAGKALFIWVGNGANKSEKRYAMTRATEYLKQNSKPLHTPITVVKEGSECAAFNKALPA